MHRYVLLDDFFYIRMEHTIFQTGIYEHYKGKRYEVLGLVRHSETMEEMVLYKPLYHVPNDDILLRVRPRTMFEEHVIVDGHTMPRFQIIR